MLQIQRHYQADAPPREATPAERGVIRQFIDAAVTLFAEDASHHHPECQCSVCGFLGFGPSDFREGR